MPHMPIRPRGCDCPACVPPADGLGVEQVLDRVAQVGAAKEVCDWCACPCRGVEYVLMRLGDGPWHERKFCGWCRSKQQCKEYEQATGTPLKVILADGATAEVANGKLDLVVSTSRAGKR